MTRIAVLGATSQIAKDLIRRVAAAASHDLILYARDCRTVEEWLTLLGLSGRYPVCAYNEYGQVEHEAVINFVGVGDPLRAAVMGGSIFDITLQYDQMVLNQLRQHPQRRYIFISSGAAYGSTFLQPADALTRAAVSINALTPQEYYSVAKLHAECRHRALPDFSIIDLRVFNYFSRTQNLDARFFVTDMLRAIRTGTLFQTSSDAMVRDYLHPDDFCQLVNRVLNAPPLNTALDCYSHAPVEKTTLLEGMATHFGLRYEFIAGHVAPVNATGTKPFYYSMNRKAQQLDYCPAYTSLDTVLTETEAILREQAGA